MEEFRGNGMAENDHQATITVTFYFRSGNEPTEQLKKKYVVQSWDTEDDLRRLLDEIASELNYLSGYGIRSITVAAKQMKFTIDYDNRFMPYSYSLDFFGFRHNLKFEVGEQYSGRATKRVWFEIPRVSIYKGYMDIVPKYDSIDRLFQIKLEYFRHKRKKQILHLSFDRDNPILISFLHKIYEGEILLPDVKHEWRHNKQRAYYMVWKTLPEAQTTQYQWKKSEKQEKTEKREKKLLERHEKQTTKLLKKHGIVADEPQPRVKPTQVYIIQQIGEHGFSTLYKIGISKSPQKRLQGLTTSNPFELKIVHTFVAEPAEEAEAQLHAKYEHIHQKGEWFKLTDEQLTELLQIKAFKDGQFIKGEVLDVK
jgi:hypothetical protein